MFTEDQIVEIVDLLTTLSPETKIYIGTDSVRFQNGKRWYAKYATVCVIHKNGNNGGRIFTSRSVEPDYDLKVGRPSMRLMNEVMKSCEAYNQLAPFIDEFVVSIHIDVNVDPLHGSNCVAQQAAGYALGVTGLPESAIKLKPEAWGASCSADWAARRTASVV